MCRAQQRSPAKGGKGLPASAPNPKLVVLRFRSSHLNGQRMLANFGIGPLVFLARASARERKRRARLIWIDDPHATDADRERARQQAIADGWIKEADDVIFVSWTG